MNYVDIVYEIEKISEEMIEKKYQKEYKKIITESFIKFLNNENEISEKLKLLKLLKKVKWYSNYKTDTYFSNIIAEMLEKLSGEIYYICKNKITSSCYSIVTNLLREGNLEGNNIIIYNKNTKTIDSKILKEESTILLMDDYSGSGNTIINMIEAIEKEYSNKRILILIYVWQKNAIKRIKAYIDKKLKNNYRIIEKGIILEDSYKEKFDKDIDSINYIETVCNGCEQKDFRYGYMETGAMLTFDGISPNNNISMLWNNNINYNNNRWFPVFNREYSLELLRRKKNEYLRKKKEVIKIYNESFLKEKFTYKEFKVLIILFNTYSVRTEYIKEALGFDTIEEITEIVEKLIKCGIITYSTENILQFIDAKAIKELKRIEEKISGEVGIIKGTRKQISKVTPLE